MDNIKYLSLFLVISFFFLHKILLVFIGIIFAIYDLNKNLISNKILFAINKVLYRAWTGIYTPVKGMIIKECKKDDSKQLLVYKVEELGFIPSLDNDDFISK